MKLRRPHIPISTRVLVAARQLQERYELGVVLAASLIKGKRRQLQFMLVALFGDERPHLDHDPCLALRFFNEETGEYDPPANSVEHLVYRTKSEHDVKTRIRGDHGAFSDHAMIRREKKRLKLKTDCTERQARRDQVAHGNQRLGMIGRVEVKPAGADRSKRRFASAPSRWPPKGSRPLRGRPF